MLQFFPKRLDASLYSTFLDPELLSLVFHLRREYPQLFNAAVLPEQFHSASVRAYRESGAVALMRAVLDDAIHCFQKYSNATGARAHRLAKEAEDWLFSDDEEWTFSFVNICFVLGLDPAALRHKLRDSQHSPSRSPQRKKHIAIRRRQRSHIVRAA